MSVVKSKESDPFAPRVSYFMPTPQAGELDANRVYRVVARAGDSWDYAVTAHDAPEKVHLLDRTVGETLRHQLRSAANRH